MSDRSETKHLEPDSLLDAAPDAVVILDEDGCIRFVNAQATVLLGYSCEELEGQPVEILVPERFRHQQEADRRHYMDHLYTRPMGHGQRLFVRRRASLSVREPRRAVSRRCACLRQRRHCA